MLTVVETLHFQTLWDAYWTEEERGEFAAYIAANPMAGDVVRGSGGVRVIYYTRTKVGEVVLMFIYAKSKLDTLSGATLKGLRDAAEKAND